VRVIRCCAAGTAFALLQPPQTQALWVLENMNERSGFLMVLPIGLFVVGSLIPLYMIGLDTSSDAWREKTVFLMYLSLIILLAWALIKIQKNNRKFKKWSTDTIVGVNLIAFAYSFILSLGVTFYMLLPLPSIVTFIVSIVISILSFIAFMEMGNAKNS